MPNYSFVEKQLEQWQFNDSLLQKNSKFLKKIHDQSRKNSISYMQSIDKRKSRPQSSPSPSIQIKPSINELRQMSSQQRIQTQKIQNRLKYLHTSTDRQQKLINTAKQKFYKLNEVRRQSFTEKSFFTKQRKSLLIQHKKNVCLKASLIKSERQRTAESQQKVFLERKSKVDAVKKQRKWNQAVIKDKKQHQQSIRSEKVLRIHQQQQIQRQRSLNRSKQRIDQGVMNHKKDILTQYQQVQRQIKTKKNLMKSFEQKATKIFNTKQRQEKQLEQYRAYLGLNKSEINSSRTSPVIDNTMLFNSRQKETNNTKAPYQQSFSRKKPNNRKQSASFYLTNPENHH